MHAKELYTSVKGQYIFGQLVTVESVMKERQSGGESMYIYSYIYMYISAKEPYISATQLCISATVSHVARHVYTCIPLSWRRAIGRDL